METEGVSVSADVIADMFRQPVSLRTLAGLVVLSMGALGMSLALVTGEIYHRLTLENQRRALASLAGLAVDEALGRLEDKTRSLGLSLPGSPAFEPAFAARDHTALQKLLDDQFHQYFVTAGEIRLIQLRLYGPDLEHLASATEGRRDFPPGRAACPGLLERAAQRRGHERLQLISALCADPQPLYSQIVPIGGLRLRGYVEVVADPSYSLESLEKALGMPLRLRNVSGHQSYLSAAWPAETALGNMLGVEYPVRNAAGDAVLQMTLLSDVADLHRQLDATRQRILLVASLITGLVAAAAFWLLRRTALQPIAQLLRHLQTVRQNGVAADGTGAQRVPAVKELRVLQDLYRSLDQLAYTDPLTLLPNRAQFVDFLDRHTAEDRRSKSAGFALMIMDLDGFKQVNDRYGHPAGDRLLRDVACRLAGIMRTGDVLSRLQAESTAVADGDLLARLGGDEFGVLLPGVISRASAAAVADKFLHAMREPFALDYSRACSVGLSIGIAFYPADGADREALVACADAAMYSAKRQRSGYAFSDGDNVSPPLPESHAG